MATTAINNEQQISFTNRIHHGDCIQIMKQMPANSVDFILTDPPYLVNYRDRTGRTIHNDDDESWLKPAMAQAYRVLKQDRVAVMFYGWTKIDRFFEAWLGAGFHPVGHIVFHKNYSSKSRFLRYQHEQAFQLAKGRPPTAETTSRRCDRYALRRQQASSHTETDTRTCTFDSQFHTSRRDST